MITGRYCPICGESVPYGVRLEALPPNLLGRLEPGYNKLLHRCNPKRLAAIDAALSSDYETRTRQRTEAERLAEGFRQLKYAEEQDR